MVVDDLEAQAKLVAAVMVSRRESVVAGSVVGVSGGGKVRGNKARGAGEENADGGDGGDDGGAASEEGEHEGQKRAREQTAMPANWKQHASVLRSVIEPESRVPDDHANEIETAKFPRRDNEGRSSSSRFEGMVFASWTG